MEGNDDFVDDNLTKSNDTALHVAISNDAGLDALRTIIEKGADVNAINDDGKTPFECIKHGSLETAINLLKLEKDFDLRDDNGDSFLHVLMDSVGDSVWGIRHSIDGKVEFGQVDQEQMITIFWDIVLEHPEQFAINLNSQDSHGCTPVHIAADYWPSMKSLEVMLSSFEHFNPFVFDFEGENFLHRYFLRHKGFYMNIPSLQNKMLKGELKYLPKETVAQLLNIQNTSKNTPLHILIKFGDGKAVTDFEDILEGGADPNIVDWIGDTALHCIFKKYINQLEEDTYEIDDEELRQFDSLTDRVIKCLVAHGANVNTKNKKGETPIFLAKRKEHIDTLLALGAEVNVKNNLQQTPLLYFVSKENVELDTLYSLLKGGSNVFAVDAHGNTVLHYIAWHGYHRDFLTVLNNHEIATVRDNIGQLPCDVAFMQGHKAIFNELCKCSRECHPNREHLYLANDIVQLTELIKTPQKFHEKLNCIRQYRDENIANILKFPAIGSVQFEGEAAEVKEVTRQIVESICKKLADKAEFWKCKVIQSGSVGENTKVSYPNEFDFVFIIEKLGEICYIDEQKSRQDQG